MFDSNEIAERALHRAGEIKAETKRRHRMYKKMLLTGAAVASMALIITVFPIGKLTGDILIIDDEQLPLAEFPLADEDAPPPSEDGMEEFINLIIPSFDIVTVPTNTQSVNLELTNPEGSPYLVGFEITLAGSEELLYKSGFIEPSTRTAEITLTRPLQKGEYKAVLTVRVYETNSLNEVFSGEEEFTLIVL